MKRAYPDMKLLECDVFSAYGYINLGCVLDKEKIVPALAPKLIAENTIIKPEFSEFAEAVGGFAVCALGNVYLVGVNGDVYKSEQTVSTNRPFMADYSGAVPQTCIIGGDKCIRLIKTGLSAKQLNYSIFGGVFKNSRVFAVDSEDEYLIRWSGADGFDDWSESISGAGWIYVNGSKGKILRLVAYNDGIAALCEHGIAVLTAYGAPENFKLTYIDGELPYIWGCTAAFAHGKLIFFAGSNLYSFDGSRTEKIELGSQYGISNPTCACSLGGWYYICGYCESLERNAVLCVNIADGKAYFADIAGLTVCAHEQVYAFARNALYELDYGAFSFESGNIDFGTGKRKALESIELVSDKKCDIEISNGVKTRILRDVNGFIRLNMSGNSFKFKICGSARIESLKAFAEVINEI